MQQLLSTLVGNSPRTIIQSIPKDIKKSSRRGLLYQYRLSLLHRDKNTRILCVSKVYVTILRFFVQEYIQSIACSHAK
jgi:hypothetical protein